MTTMTMMTWTLLGGLAHSLLPFLSEWALRGAVVLAVAAAATLLLRRGSAALRHLVWSLGMAVLLLLPVLDGVVPDWRVVPAFLPGDAVTVTGSAPGVASGGAASPAETSGGASAVATGIAPAPGRASSAETGAAAPAVASGGGGARVLPAARFAPSVERPLASAPAARPSMMAAAVPLALLLAWFLGACVLLARVGIGAVQAGAMAREGRPVDDPSVRRLARSAAAAVGLRRPVTLLWSDRAPVPLTFGATRPILLLPAAAAGWEPARLRQVFLHELAHVGRGDYAWGLLAEVGRALHWMNPLAWLAVARLRFERERACDDRVLRAGCRASDYAENLLDVAAGLRDGWRPRAGAVPMARPRELGDRLRAILDPAVRREPVRAPAALAAVVAAALLAVPVAALSPVAAESPVSADASVAAEFSFAAEGPLSTAAASAAQELCVFRDSGKRSTRINSDEDRTRIEWSTDDCDVDIDLRGDVEFAADDSGITRVPPGGRFEIEETFGRSSRRVVAESGPGGRPAFTYWRDRDERAFDPEGRAWLAAILPELFRHTTLNAEARVRRILKRDGVDGVLAEIDRVSSDHVAAVYFEHLLAMADLDEGQIREVFGIAARRIDSDHYLTSILTGAVERRSLTPPVREAFLDAVQEIDSDHYTHRLLSLLLDQPDLDQPTRARILDTAARRLDSDHYLSQILEDLVETGRLDQVGRTAFLRTLRGLDSDHYRRRVVGTFMSRGGMTESEIAEVLALSGEIGSDHYRASLLQDIARDHELSGEALEAWIRSLDEIDSDHYVRQTLEEILDHPRLDAARLALVLELTARIDSDHHRAELLTGVARRHRLEGDLRQAYLAAAEGIDSRHYRDRALAVLVRSGG